MWTWLASVTPRYLFLSRTRIEAIALGKEVHSSETPALTYEAVDFASVP